MKRLFISSTLILSFISCLAQWDYRATIEFSAGGALPIGEFSYSRYDYEGSGFAEPGLALSLSFNYRVNGHLGLVASVSEYLLGVDEENVALKYWTPGTIWSFEVEASRWMINPYMGGIDIILPIYKSDLSFRLLGGFARTRLPGLTGNEYNFTREATRDVAAAWSIGAGLTNQNHEKITLSFRLDIFMTRPYLEEIWSSDLGSGSSKESQNISIVSLTAALGFRVF